MLASELRREVERAEKCTAEEARSRVHCYLDLALMECDPHLSGFADDLGGLRDSLFRYKLAMNRALEIGANVSDFPKKLPELLWQVTNRYLPHPQARDSHSVEMRRRIIKIRTLLEEDALDKINPTSKDLRAYAEIAELVESSRSSVEVIRSNLEEEMIKTFSRISAAENYADKIFQTCKSGKDPNEKYWADQCHQLAQRREAYTVLYNILEQKLAVAV